MIAAQENKYVLFENAAVKWVWKEWELIRFRDMWNAGEPINVIAKALKTNQRSIGLLIQDQAEEDFIKQRRMGLGV
ncbi:helix-turn-helix domain containing protein [Sporosarcina sp. FSL K6-2383]|uniref:helix-turn-helix domain containing protein n=1 Tax=Sporosarcina sp. FSL K6-2383 TaxID=2921556 RepID=UPI00315AB380